MCKAVVYLCATCPGFRAVSVVSTKEGQPSPIDCVSIITQVSEAEFL